MLRMMQLKRIYFSCSRKQKVVFDILRSRFIRAAQSLCELCSQSVVIFNECLSTDLKPCYLPLPRFVLSCGGISQRFASVLRKPVFYWK
jgi:hypothetical protein